MATMTRMEHSSRINEERRRAERGKNLIVLMLQHLINAGYTGSVEALQAESGVSLAQYEVADNIELLSVLQEWEDYYEMRFSRRPKLVRKLSAYSGAVDPHGKEGARKALEATLPRLGGGGSRPRVRSGSVGGDDHTGGDDAPSSSRANGGSAGRRARSGGGTTLPSCTEGVSVGGVGVGGSGVTGKESKAGAATRDRVPTPSDDGDGGGLSVTGTTAAKAAAPEEAPGPWEHRVRKAGLPPAMAASTELRELAGWLQRDMIQENPNVRWDSIAELPGVKRVLKESLVMPLRFPQFFTGLLMPWKGVLLYGPPGTGKTLLAKAVATECNTTFFNISASSIVSKWRGDSEKLVRVLFELARHHAPSTIFLDEIDALMSQRGDSGEHEGSRRMKTELLVQMDGLLASDSQVFVLAATNLPWELDMALLRRLEKRILVPLPTQIARSTIIESVLPRAKVDKDVDYNALAKKAEGYSGSDIVLVCKEAAMRPLRTLLSQIDENAVNGGLPVGARPGLVSADDFDAAFATTKSSVQAYAERYKQWESEFGSA